MGGFLSSSSPKLLYNVEKSIITDLINTNCVVIFSKTHCNYCKKVKKLLNDCEVPYLSVELDKRDDGSDLQNALHEMTGAKTVPRVFINSECVGGASETEKLHKENKLFERIQMCDKSI